MNVEFHYQFDLKEDFRILNYKILVDLSRRYHDEILKHHVTDLQAIFLYKSMMMMMMMQKEEQWVNIHQVFLHYSVFLALDMLCHKINDLTMVLVH
jgi:hypothetical protein